MAGGHAVEEAGIQNLSVMDHYFQMEMAGGPEKPMLEGYTALGFVAEDAVQLGFEGFVEDSKYIQLTKGLSHLKPARL